jgi:hypothetical protein
MNTKIKLLVVTCVIKGTIFYALILTALAKERKTGNCSKKNRQQRISCPSAILTSMSLN